MTTRLFFLLFFLSGCLVSLDQSLIETDQGPSDGPIADARDADLNPCAGLEPATDPSIVFTELLIDPEGGIGRAGEWIEIHNKGVDRVWLTEWSLADSDNCDDMEKPLCIGPSEYMLLAPEANTTVTHLAPSYLYEDALGLSKSQTDRIELYRAACINATTPPGAATLVDRVEWDPTGSWSALVVNGQSMSLSDVSLSNDDPDHWCVEPSPWPGGDGIHTGTPGSATGCL